MMINKLPISAYFHVPKLVSTPDGGVLYIGSRSVNYIGPVPDDAEKTPEIKVICMRQNLRDLDVDPGWNKQSSKIEADITKPKEGRYFAVLAEDKSLQIWDFDKGIAVRGHNAHNCSTRQQEGYMRPKYESAVLLSFMSNRNVLSIDAQDIIVYCVASNTFCRLPTFITSRNVKFTTLRCSPYKENIFALGTSRGLVLVCDINEMKIIYTLRGHNSPITKFSWIRVDPKQLGETAGKVVSPLKCDEDDELFDIYNFDYLESEFGAPVSRQLNHKSPDIASDFVGIEKPAAGDGMPVIDYIEACENVKAELMAYQRESGGDDVDAQDFPNNEVTLADCQKANIGIDGKSSSSSSNRIDSAGLPKSESTEGSLELVQYSSSDDAVVVDGDDRKPRHEVLHHIYHQAEVHAAGVLPKGQPLKNKNPELCGTKSYSSPEGSVSLKRNEDENHDVLLLSASEDANLWLWNTATGAIYENLGTRGSGKDKFIDVTWVQDGNSIFAVSTNKSNVITIWTLCYMGKRYKLEEEKYRRQLPHDIVAIAKYLQPHYLWGITKSRKIILFDTKTGFIKAQYAGVSSNIHAISECPDDMNKIALGLFDKRLGIFDISKLTPRCISIENIVPITGAIYSFAWSPDSIKLAYGTMDGKVGVVNLETFKSAFIFKPVFSKEVYSVKWKGDYIYFICNQMIGVYDVNRPKMEAYIINEIKRPTAFSVKGNYLFVGTQNGELQVFRLRPDGRFSYERLQNHVLMPRYVSEIVWSPHQDDVFAVAGNDPHVYIFRFDRKSTNLETKLKLILPGKKPAIASIRWSFLSENLIVTAGLDGNICVWDLNNPLKELLIKVYYCPMLCACFLPSDDNVIMCAGTSTSLEFININQEIKEKPKESNNLNCLLNVQWATKSFIQPDTKAVGVAEKKRTKKLKRDLKKKQNSQNQQFTNTECKPQFVHKTKDCDDDLRESEKSSAESNLEHKMSALTIASKPLVQASIPKETQTPNDSTFLVNSDTLLHLVTKELNKDALQQLTVLLADPDKAQDSVLCGKLFGSKANANELLQKELLNHKNSDTKGMSRICMSQMSLNLEEEIKNCIESKTLNEWLVSLTPSISYTFWRDCCIAFANQLIEQGYVMHGVTYMIAASQKYDAIETLLNKKYFKEALLFSRVYLAPDDPLFDKIVKQWISHLEDKGNLPAATLIGVLSGDFTRGYQLLSKIRKPTAEMQNVLQQLKQKSDDLTQLLAKSEAETTETVEAAEKGA